jgi:hypothetical protein
MRSWLSAGRDGRDALRGVGWVRTLNWSPDDPSGSALLRVRTEEDK